MRIRRKFIFKLSLLGLVAFTLYSFRFSILSGAGNFLIRQDDPTPVDAIYVLSGNPVDRGRKAAALYHQGFSPVVVCTGGEKSTLLEAYGKEVVTCDITRQVLIRMGVDSSHIALLCKGTSTYEEYEAIKAQCKEKGWNKIMVVSSLFHTRRINNFFRSGLAEAGIELVLIGAPESGFSEAEWWKKEEGLIFLNNEYIKILYYLVKF
jgi:uncharacterized SAM-binding protein YcdF (DUF218 family)